MKLICHLQFALTKTVASHDDAVQPPAFFIHQYPSYHTIGFKPLLIRAERQAAFIFAVQDLAQIGFEFRLRDA